MKAQQSQSRHSGAIHAPRRVSHAKPPLRSSAQEVKSRTGMYFDSFWVRSALSQLEFLASGQAVDAGTRRLIEFAIRWAPFGGSDDLLVTFGVDRRRFVALIDEGLGVKSNCVDAPIDVKRRDVARSEPAIRWRDAQVPGRLGCRSPGVEAAGRELREWRRGR